MEITKRYKFIFLWSGIGALALCSIAFLPWRFQVNDDVTMMWLVSGAYTGTPESYAVFIHPLLSWCLSKLYTRIFWIPWYEGIWFLSIYFSFILLLVSISRSQSAPLVKSLQVFFLLLISLHFAIFPQFTLVAGFLVFSSIVFLNEYEAGLSRGVAFLLLTLGIMIRWESAVLIFLGYTFYTFFSKGNDGLSFNFFRKNSVIIFLFVGIIGSKSIYEVNSPYSDFLRFNRLRAAVIDHPVFYQDTVKKKIPYGSELFFFSRWYFEDMGISEVDLMEKKKDLDERLFSIDHVFESFERLWRFQRFEAFKSFLIFGILLFFFSTVKKKGFLLFFFAAWMLFFLLFNHFYLIQGRVIFLFFLCLLFPVFKFKTIYVGKKVIVCLFLLFFMAFGFHFLNFLKEAKERAVMDQEFLSITNQLSPSTPIVVEGYHEQNWRFKFSSLNPVPFISTGWISRSDFQKKALQRMGISSFAAIEKFAFITPTVNNEIVFPDYMNHAFGAFVQTDSVRTDNFILLQFEKIGN